MKLEYQTKCANASMSGTGAETRHTSTEFTEFDGNDPRLNGSEIREGCIKKYVGVNCCVSFLCKLTRRGLRKARTEGPVRSRKLEAQLCPYKLSYGVVRLDYV